MAWCRRCCRPSRRGSRTFADLLLLVEASVMAYSNLPAGEKLYAQLPAYIREKDAAEGQPLKGLLALIETQADIVDHDIRQLYNDAFIETCERWVVPYIGDLVANVPLFDESRVRDGDTAGELFLDLTGPSLKPRIGLGARADVAKTIYYRRRKGTLAHARGAGARRHRLGGARGGVLPILGWTQWLRNHVRPTAYRTSDIRSVERMDRIAGAFDEIAHTVDVRRITSVRRLAQHPEHRLLPVAAAQLRAERRQARRVGPAGTSATSSVRSAIPRRCSPG